MVSKDLIKIVIGSFWDKKIELVKREDINIFKAQNKVISIIGPRRAGKTYLLYEKIQDLLENGIKKEQILYFNLEDERVLPFKKEDFEKLLESFYELYPQSINEKIHIFLDEIQEVEYWEKFVRRLSENKSYSIYITGSSSKLLSREIATSLRGRTLTHYLYPFSFKEYLKFFNIEIEPNYKYSNQRFVIKKHFEDYLKFGGFPETFNQTDDIKIKILQEYYDLIFYKDLIERFEIRNIKIIKELMRYVVSNYASVFSITNYYNILKSSGEKIGKETLFEYTSYLEDVNFLKLISIYDYSLKKQQVNPKKSYVIDNGLITATSFAFSENYGRLLENLVLIELLRRENEIYYHKDNCECDFVIKKGLSIINAIQVTKSLDDIDTKKRELNGLIDAMKTYNLKEGLILTNDESDEFDYDGYKIKVIPIWQWLINS